MDLKTSFKPVIIGKKPHVSLVEILSQTGLTSKKKLVEKVEKFDFEILPGEVITLDQAVTVIDAYANGGRVDDDKRKRMHAYRERIKNFEMKERGVFNLLDIVRSFDRAVHSRNFIVVSFLCAIFFQMNHSSTIAQQVSLYKSGWSFIICWVFAFAFEFTAISLTIHGAKRQTLKLFAFLHFIINLLYYQPWTGFKVSDIGITLASVKVILSAAIAYCIYSYSELYTSKKA